MGNSAATAKFQGLSVAEFVRQEMHQFTKAERRISHVLLNFYPTLGLDTAANFAKEAGVSSPSILRFVSRLGFEGYPAFQKHLRNELAEQMRSPLSRTEAHEAEGAEYYALQSAAANMSRSIEMTISKIPPREVEAICEIMSDPKKNIFFLGGRLSSSLASIVFVQLRTVRKKINLLDHRPDNLMVQLVDMSQKDVVVVFDIRRYSADILSFCELAEKRGANIILITDSWVSPISRFAKHMLAVHTETHETWDTLSGLLLVTEALIAEVTKRTWTTACDRMKLIESLRDEPSRAKLA